MKTVKSGALVAVAAASLVGLLLLAGCSKAPEVSAQDQTKAQQMQKAYGQSGK